MAIHLYAEHLVHIGTLSIQASLITPADETTTATLSSDGRSFELTHRGNVARIELPAQIPIEWRRKPLPFPQRPTTDLSLRISTRGPTIASRNGSAVGDAAIQEGNTIPWSAGNLGPSVEISCRECGTTILPSGAVQTWKDLPSENWAEMMDFWHCHRPHEPHGQHDGAQKKGYSAASKLALFSGVGMVDPIDFVLFPEDCANIMVGTLLFLLRACRSSTSSAWPCRCRSRGNMNHNRAQKNRSFQAARSSSREVSGYKCPRLSAGERRN